MASHSGLPGIRINSLAIILGSGPSLETVIGFGRTILNCALVSQKRILNWKENKTQVGFVWFVWLVWKEDL